MDKRFTLSNLTKPPKPGLLTRLGAAFPIERVPEAIWQAKGCLETGNLAEAKAALTKAGYTVLEITA